MPFAGVAAYVAPEVANGVKGGPKADVFSLGATLYAAVEGRSPWGDGDVVGTLAAAMKGAVVPPRRAGDLAPVLARMLQRRPRERPSAAAAAQMLAQVARGEPVGARPRWPWAVGAAAVAVLVVLGLVLWPRPAPAPVAAAPPGIGDPASADPCSLLRTEPFERFGDATLENDYGNFDRCDVIMEAGADRFAVRAQFIQSPEELPEGAREERDGLVIVRSALVDEQCTRRVRLPDGYDVWIVARSERGAIPDLCAVADTATDLALPVLAAGPVPRRQTPFDPASLALVDSCGLVDQAAVATVPGLETADPDRGFAGWDCQWDTPDTEAAVQVRYDHETGLDADMGTPARIAGRDAAVLPDDDRTGCEITILHRSYIDQFGYPYSELLVVEIDLPAPAEDPCAQALNIAELAAEQASTVS
jgi:hypothetical protein